MSKRPVSTPAKRTHWLRKRKIKAAIAMVLFLFVLLNASAALHAWRLTRFKDYGNARPVPAQMSLGERMAFAVTGGFSPKSKLKRKPAFPHDQISIQSQGGVTLRGWQSNGHSDTTGTVILCHGHGATRSALLSEAQSLYDMGLRVVMFDFRAHGESDGQVCSIGYHEADDVKAAWDYVRERYPSDSIVLYGISMGAVSIARAVAVHDLEPAAVVLDMPFNRLLDAVRSRVSSMGLPAEPAASLLTFWGGVHLGYWGFNHTTADYVKDISCPILLQWGALDKGVSKAEIETIRDAAAPGSLHLEVYPDAGHTSLRKSSETKWTEGMKRLMSRVPLAQ